MPLVMQEYPNSSASRACSNISRKCICMSSPCGNCARIINPNCMSAMVCFLSARPHSSWHNAPCQTGYYVPQVLRTAIASMAGYCVRLVIPRQYGGGPLAVRSTRALSDVCANALDGLLPLREQPGKEMPDVDHLLPDFESHVYPCRLGALRQACCIIE